MNKKFKIIGSVVAIILVITLIGTGIYLNDYYHANESAISTISNTSNVTVSETNDYIYFEAIGTNNHSIFSKSNSSNLTGKKGLIFYPGGKVAPESYAPLAKKISESGYDVAIAKMPFNLAILDTNKANMILNEHSDVNWIIGGHSLGGSAASSFASSNSNSVNGIVFLASYPIDNMSDTGIKGLSIVGSNDGVLNKEEFNKAKTKFPINTDFQVINGGNHAYFGDYGFQSGDNNASISQATQENETVNLILKFFESL
ncbi:MAG: alpha/beta hydrolase [Methanobacteriaceae archaeon]